MGTKESCHSVRFSRLMMGGVAEAVSAIIGDKALAWTATRRLGLGLVLAACAAAAARAEPVNPGEIPAWRGKAPGTAYLGPDALWRPREWLVFHMLDEKGGGFNLTFTVRDMNVYMQGPRPVFFLALGPKDEIFAQSLMEDDGVVSGNERHRDGIYDTFQDLRYREWHKCHSPNGYPPGKERSPMLDAPERLAARSLTLTIPPSAGPGLYRVVVIASWDHWISVTPDRPLPTGVHPGPGPLYAHKDRLKDAFVYVPKGAQDIGLALTEEIQPYSWTVSVRQEDGKEVGHTTPRTSYSYLILKDAIPETVYRVSVSGSQAGCCLSMDGLPFVLCPDADTARRIHGGVEVDGKGRWTYHHSARELLRWSESRRPEELAVEAKPPEKPFPLLDRRKGITTADAPRILESQDLDPKSPSFGVFKDTGDKEFEKKFNCFGSKADALTQLFTSDRKDNPYFGDQALLRRVLLSLFSIGYVARQGPYSQYEHAATPKRYGEFKEDQFWGLPFRSGWMGLATDALHVNIANSLKPFVEKALPQDVVKQWKRSVALWGYSRALAHAGECTNQWGLNLSGMANCCKFADDPALTALLNRGVERWSTPGVLGRVNPDPSPYSSKSSVGYGHSCDMGWTGAGFPADGQGFDTEYCNEGVAFIRGAYEVTRQPGVVARWGDYMRLKAHLALPVDGKADGSLTCPTDMAHRTPFNHAAPPIYDEMAGQDYYDAFKYSSKMKARKSGEADPRPPAKPFPCLDDGSFVRNFDNLFYFVKTPAYYSIVYAGETTPQWTGFAGKMRTKDGSTAFYGSPDDCGYGGKGRVPSKLGGVSAVFVKGCGPVLLTGNQNVFYTNNVWSRRRMEAAGAPPLTGPGGVHIPEYDCGGYVTPWVSFDERNRVVNKTLEFQYVPLLINRTIFLRDDLVAVSLEVFAKDDLDLEELCEAIPYYAAPGRTVRLFKADWSEGAKLPVWGVKDDGKDIDDSPATFRAVDIASATGAGAAFVFEKEMTFKQTPPFNNVRSFNLPLSAKMTRGTRQAIRYLIVPHQQAVTAAQLKQAALSERLPQ